MSSEGGRCPKKFRSFPNEPPVADLVPPGEVGGDPRGTASPLRTLMVLARLIFLAFRLAVSAFRDSSIGLVGVT
jgi:hypothetical protein